MIWTHFAFFKRIEVTQSNHIITLSDLTSKCCFGILIISHSGICLMEKRTYRIYLYLYTKNIIKKYSRRFGVLLQNTVTREFYVKRSIFDTVRVRGHALRHGWRRRDQSSFTSLPPRGNTMLQPDLQSGILSCKFKAIVLAIYA